jgi:hypothetical protein
LTYKQRAFIEAFFACGMNATEAALQVYNTKDRHVAQTIGSENLSKPVIRARVDERLQQFHMTADEVLARIAYHARGSLEDFIDPGSGAIDLSAAKEARSLGLIKRYRTKQIINSKDDTEILETEIEMYDAQAALRDLGKHLGLFVDRNVSLNVDMTTLSDDDLAAIAAGKMPARKVELK